MLKRLVQLLVEFGAGLAGNLVAGWIQQDVWSNLFTPTRLVGTLAGAGVMLLLLAWLESERALPWNWPWHRFWYVRELLENPDLRRWETDFARLELAQGRRKVSGAQVIADGERRDLIEVLRNVIADRQGEVRRALVLGEPGSGKTTALERLTLELAREGARRRGFGHPMPVLVRLGNFQEGRLLDYVGQAMRDATRRRSGRVLDSGVEELIEKGRVALLFDALDEALGERRERVLAGLASFLESHACEHVPVVITSRTREDPGGRLKDLQVFEIQDLSDAAVEVFIRAYKQPEHNEGEIRKGLERHRLLEPGGLGRNPFWLRLIVETGAFQGNKGQILNQAVDTLLAREWDEKPETERSWRRVLPREEQLNETKRALASLGYRMSVEHQVEFTEDQALAELDKWLAKRTDVRNLGPRDILGLGRDAQVLVYDPGPVRFRHRLLQEFMTARALSTGDGLLTREFLEQCVQDTDWWETLLILGGLVPDHAKLVQDVLRDGSDDRRLFLAVGLLQSVDEPDAKLTDQVTAALVESLRQGATPEHKRAAVQLARIAGQPLVERLGELLRKEDRVVREATAEILSEIGSQEALPRLIRALGDPLVADHVAHVLVSAGQRAVEPLIAALRDEDWYVRERAAQALVKIGEPAVEPLIAALRDEERHVRKRAAEALGQIGDAQAVEPLIAALGDAVRGVRWSAAEALGQIGDARAVEPLIAALGDEVRGVRWSWSAAGAFRLIRDVRAMEPLIAALGDEVRGVRWGAAGALGEIGEPAVELLIKVLQYADEAGRFWAAWALGEIGDVQAVEPLIEALLDADEEVRERAAEALGKIGDGRALPYLERVAREDSVVADVARKAIGRIEAK